MRAPANCPPCPGESPVQRSATARIGRARIPRLATLRRLVSSAMEAMRTERIPLFPLNVVLLPGADLPLHIFEPRYRQMVKQCLANNQEFGVLLALPDGIAHVGCTAEIVEVVKRHPDGRMDILTVGRAPFRVVELFASNPLLEGNVDYLEDVESRPHSAKRQELLE